MTLIWHSSGFFVFFKCFRRVEGVVSKNTEAPSDLGFILAANDRCLVLSLDHLQNLFLHCLHERKTSRLSSQDISYISQQSCCKFLPSTIGNEWVFSRCVALKSEVPHWSAQKTSQGSQNLLLCWETIWNGRLIIIITSKRNLLMHNFTWSYTKTVIRKWFSPAAWNCVRKDVRVRGSVIWWVIINT